MWLTTLWTGTIQLISRFVGKYGWKKYIVFMALPAGGLLLLGSYCNW